METFKISLKNSDILKAMKIFFLLFFLLQPGKVHASGKLISCKYMDKRNSGKNKIIYKFDETEFDKRVSELLTKTLIEKTNNLDKIRKLFGYGIFKGTGFDNSGFGGGSEQVGLRPIQDVVQEGMVGVSVNPEISVIYDKEFKRGSDSVDSFCDSETVAVRVNNFINDRCQFEALGGKCKNVFNSSLEEACGYERHKDNIKEGSDRCQAGVVKLEKDWDSKKNNPTPGDIEKYENIKNKLLSQALKFKGHSSGINGGYKLCAKGIRDAMKKGCFEAYDHFFNETIKKMVIEKCSIKAISDYVSTFKGHVQQARGPLKTFERLRNYHIKARLCTLKIVKVAEKLDRELKEAAQKIRQKPDQSFSREMASGNN